MTRPSLAYHPLHVHSPHAGLFSFNQHRISHHTVTIDNPLLSHLSKSLRIREGEEIWVGDEHRVRYRVRIDHLDSTSLQASIIETIEGPPSPSAPIVLAQAILKGDRMNWVIQKATELGVTKIIPLLTSKGHCPSTGRSHPNRTRTLAADRRRCRAAIGAMGVPHPHPSPDVVRVVQARSPPGTPVRATRTKCGTQSRFPVHRSHVPGHYRTGRRPRRRMDAGRKARTPRPTLSTHVTGQKYPSERNRSIGSAEHPATSIGEYLSLDQRARRPLRSCNGGIPRQGLGHALCRLEESAIRSRSYNYKDAGSPIKSGMTGEGPWEICDNRTRRNQEPLIFCDSRMQGKASRSET